MTYASCCAISMRRGLGGFRLRRDSRGRGGRSCLTAQYFEHHSAAGRAFSLDCFAPIFHRFFDTIDDFLLGFAFDTVSFRHRKRWLPRRFMRRCSYRNSLKVRRCQRQQRKDRTVQESHYSDKYLISKYLRINLDHAGIEISRRAFLRILPMAFLGKLGSIRTRLGTL